MARALKRAASEYQAAKKAAAKRAQS